MEPPVSSMRSDAGGGLDAGDTTIGSASGADRYSTYAYDGFSSSGPHTSSMNGYAGYGSHAHSHSLPYGGYTHAHGPSHSHSGSYGGSGSYPMSHSLSSGSNGSAHGYFGMSGSGSGAAGGLSSPGYRSLYGQTPASTAGNSSTAAAAFDRYVLGPAGGNGHAGGSTGGAGGGFVNGSAGGSASNGAGPSSATASAPSSATDGGGYAPPAPRPYADKHAPFPLPIGERAAAGVSALARQRALQLGPGAGDPADDPRFFDEIDKPLPDEVRVGLGKTRCYWNVLVRNGEDDLTMVYCDPILQEHLGTELGQFLGTSFFDYVHPEELEQCKADLHRSMTARTLTGDLSRVRYCRVPEIRRRLGCKQPPSAQDAQKFVYDQNYLTIDIVINWVGERLALAFYHAVIDMSPQDNNMTERTSWTNWCGTPEHIFNNKQCELLWKQVSLYDSPSLAVPRQPLSYVFQIHRAGNNGDILFSWPPPRLFEEGTPDADGTLVHASASAAAYHDNSYFADDFAKMVQGFLPTFDAQRIAEDSKGGGAAAEADQPHTSCTRRYRFQHTLTSEGLARKIDGIVVPYGSLVLTCSHILSEELVSRYRSSNAGLAPPPAAGAQVQLNGSAGADRNKYTASPGAAAAAQLLMGTANANGNGSGSGAPAAAPSTEQPETSDWQTPYGRGSYRQHARVGSTAESSASLDSLANASLAFDGLSPSEKRVRLEQAVQSSHGQSSVATLAAVAAAAAASEKTCSVCGTSNSPEWRKGPTGKKTLCNACGLRFARQMARQRRKAEEAAGISSDASSTKKADKAAKEKPKKPAAKKEGVKKHKKDRASISSTTTRDDESYASSSVGSAMYGTPHMDAELLMSQQQQHQQQHHQPPQQNGYAYSQQSQQQAQQQPSFAQPHLAGYAQYSSYPQMAGQAPGGAGIYGGGGGGGGYGMPPQQQPQTNGYAQPYHQQQHQQQQHHPHPQSQAQYDAYFGFGGHG